MKRKTIHLLGFIEFLILIITLLFFVLASEKTMVYLVDKVATTFELKYKNLDGNLLKNVTIDEITYQNKILAKRAHIDLNFKALLKFEAKVDDITLEEVDLHVLEKLIADLHLKKRKDQSNQLEKIPKISITSLFFSTKPYHKHDIKIDEFKFNANDLKGDLREVEIGSFSLYTENDHTNITADGLLYDGILNFNHLWITDIDLVKIKHFYQTKIVSDENNTTTKKPKQKGFSHLIKEVKINDFQTNIKPYGYKKYDIGLLKLKARELSTDLKSISAKMTTVTSKTNMWELTAEGALNNNRLVTDATVILNDQYFKRFIPFFDFKKVHPVKLNLTLNKEGLTSHINLTTNNLLTGKLKEINASIENATAYVDFKFKPLNVDVHIDGNITSLYTKQLALSCDMNYHKTFTYNGTLFSDKLRNVDNNLTKLLRNSKIRFAGDTQKVEASLSNKNLLAEYNASNYNTGIVSLKSNLLNLNEYLSLPPALDTLSTTFQANIPIDFHNLNTLDADINVRSNALNLEGVLSYHDNFILEAILKLPQKSILQNFDNNLKLDTLFPLNTKTIYENQSLNTAIKHPLFQGNINYDLAKKLLDSAVKFNDHKIALKGTKEEGYYFKASTLSLKTLQENIEDFYNFKKQPLDGEVTINGIIHPTNETELHLKSRWLVYEYTNNKFLFGEKIKINALHKEDQITIQDYYLSSYLDYDRIFYAKKPSTLSYKDKNLNIQKFWINDGAILKGNYHIAKNSATLKLDADNYHYKGREADLYLDAKLKALLSDQSILIEGDLLALKGVVTYEAKKEHYISDDDIIILQEQLAKSKAKKENKLIVDVNLLTKKNIQYRSKDTDVTLEFDLKLWKEAQKEVELLGIAKILDGTHVEAQREFKVERGEVLFAGPILNPFLNIGVSHYSDPYTILININGLLDAPIINFSATPFLTQSDILSILLFNSTTSDLLESDADTSKTAISMFGNTFAKELVENFGIKLDKLVLSTTEEGGFGVELGKKISKNITLIYINDIVQTIKVKYQHSRRFETDFTFSPETSGIDFLYKNEY
ncbi:MAG: translocation/assembly module TamB [Epsilonproteobacteria bacterium]|nr:translocation/assembly module TamB [Campylobacterota bacterium]